MKKDLWSENWDIIMYFDLEIKTPWYFIGKLLPVSMSIALAWRHIELISIISEITAYGTYNFMCAPIPKQVKTTIWWSSISFVERLCHVYRDMSIKSYAKYPIETVIHEKWLKVLPWYQRLIKREIEIKW